MNSKIKYLKIKMADLQKELDDAKAEEAEKWLAFQRKTKDYQRTGWLAFKMTDGGNAYHAEAKVYDEPSDYGIYGGRVSKLAIRDDATGNYIFHYDRGLDLGDADEILAEIANKLAIEIADSLS